MQPVTKQVIRHSLRTKKDKLTHFSKILWIIATGSDNKAYLQLHVILNAIRVLLVTSCHNSAHIKLLGEVGEVEEVLPPGCPAVLEDLLEVVVGSIIHRL